MESIIAVCAKCGVKNKIPVKKQHLQAHCGKCHEPMDVKPFALPVMLTDSTMDAFIKDAKLPVLVDFFSPTCGPCQALAPQLDKLVRTFWGKVIIAKVDTSQNPGCAAYYQIRGVPTLFFFKNGKVVDQLVGLPEPRQLSDKLNYWAKS